jgi:DnaJ family protein B protein 6
MNDQEDPYRTLDLPRSATQTQIKAAYRKLALRYHPDKQSNGGDKRKSTETFTKIGNAYEILGDPDRRAEYDRFGTIGGAAGGGRDPRQQQQHQDPFMGGGAFFGGQDPFMNDPFFGGGNGGQFGFTDPFDLFRSAFGDDFGFDNAFGRMHQQTHQNMHGGGFGSMMGGMGGMGGHMDMMNSMNQGGGGNTQFFSSSTSSSSFGGGGGNGVSESVSTSTRIINGKRQTVTERTRVNADGTVERTTETAGDDDFPPTGTLGYGGQGNNGHNTQQYLQDSSGGQNSHSRFFGSNR